MCWNVIAGIRGNMGAGFAQMNDLTIIQTAQVQYFQPFLETTKLVASGEYATSLVISMYAS